jgi:hypothetical protein
VSKTTALLDQAQPFLRDQYATVRREVGPRLAHTRDVAKPMAVDASHRARDASNKVRSEYLPLATKRASLAAAALRGTELEHARERRMRWKLVAAGAAAGAMLGAGVLLWQREGRGRGEVRGRRRVRRRAPRAPPARASAPLTRRRTARGRASRRRAAPAAFDPSGLSRRGACPPRRASRR